MAGSETLIRARNADGTYMADDPATPDVDEAWVDPLTKRHYDGR